MKFRDVCKMNLVAV